MTDYNGRTYERIEYTPYGESWIEWKDYSENNYVTPFRFTSKEKDMETGLYYYGARYLNAKTSRWLSTDPALGEYIPGAPINDEVKKQNQNLPGMGGVFNVVNMHLYHYAGNNPVKYLDPDGRIIEWVQGDGVTDKQFERVQAAAEALKNSGTEAGNRFKELEEDTTHTVTITVTNELPAGSGGGTASAKSEYGARNELIGSGTDVLIDGKAPLINGDKVLGTRLAHEVSGHAYDNYKGTSGYYNYPQGMMRQTVGRVATEEYAVGIENEYRDFLGLKQTDSYFIPALGRKVPMPIYDRSTKTWGKK